MNRSLHGMYRCSKGMNSYFKGVNLSVIKNRIRHLSARSENINSLLSSKAKSKQHREVVSLFRSNFNCGIKFDFISLSIVLNSSAYLKNIRLTLTIFGKIVTSGHTPSLWTYNALLKAFVVVGKCREGKILLDRIRKIGCEPNVISYGILMDGCCKVGDVELARGLYEQMIADRITPDAILFTLVIDVFAKGGYLDEARSVYGQMLEVGVEPSTSSLTVLVAGYGKRGLFGEVGALLEGAAARGIVIDSYTYAGYLEGLANADLLTEVKDVLSALESSGQVDHVCYSIVMKAYCKGNMIEKAMSLYDFMIEEGVSVDNHTYSIILKGIASSKGSEMAKSFFYEVQKKEGNLGVVHYNILIDAFCKEGKIQEVEGLVESMIQEGIQPDPVTINTLMISLCREGKVEEAKKLFHSMDRSCDHRHYITLINGLCKQRKVAEALSYHRKMISKGIKPSVVTITGLMAGLFAMGKVEEAGKLFEEMLKNAIEPDEGTYSVMLEGYSKNKCLPVALEIFQFLENQGFKMNVKYYGIILGGLCREKKLNEAEVVLCKMLVRGLELNVVICTTMLEGYYRAKKLEKAKDFFLQMQWIGCVANERTYDILGKIEKEGMLRQFSDLHPQLPSNGGSLDSLADTAEVVAGSAAWLGKGLSCVCVQSEIKSHPFDLTPIQEDCLHRLQNRINIEYDGSIAEHQDALKALWKAAFPEEELKGLISEQWKDMGWQGKDPSTDLRGGGFISLENLLYFARNYLKSFQDLLCKKEGHWSLLGYPFAVAGVNITYMLIKILDLEAVKPRNLVGATFLKFLAEDESAFDLLYCITFKLMDHQWLAMRVSYVDFNAVMKATHRQLESEILLEGITRLEDLPSYKLLAL